MKYLNTLFFLLVVLSIYGQPVHIGTTANPSFLNIVNPSGSTAISWDNDDAQLKGAQDALIWNRAKLRFLLDANNDNGVASQFSLFSDVAQGDNNSAPVNFNLNGGKSWVDSGNFGVRTKNPTMPLEVGGIIYSNEGGIKFPDESIQTTAAHNSSVASQGTPRLSGFLVINGLNGPIDTTLHFPLGGSFNVSGLPIYASELDIRETDGVTPVKEYGPLMLTTDISEISPFFYQGLLTGQVISNVSLFFIQEGSTGLLSHYSIQLEGSYVKSSKNEIISVGVGKFAHFQILGLHYDKIIWESHIIADNDFCWDVVLEAECGTGGG